MVRCLDPNDPNNQWPYCPSLPAAILFAILYGILTSAHIVQAFHYRKRFCWVLIMGGLWETAAFVIRILAVENQSSQGLYTPQFVLILIAPLWINAFDYMVLGRMVHYFLPGCRILGFKPQRMALVFVLLDITAFIVQLGGALMTSNNNNVNLDKLGLHIYTGGVGLQEAVILFFFALAIRFHWTLREQAYTGRETDWKALLYVLYASLTLITIRIIYRIAEFSGGPDSILPKREAYGYCLDSLPMLFALFLFNLVHPGRILIGPDSEFPKKVKLSKEEKRSLKAEKKAAKAEKKSNKENRRVDYELLPK